MTKRIVALTLLAVIIIVAGTLLPRATLAKDSQTLQMSANVASAEVLSPGSCVTTNEILDPVPFVWTYESNPEPHYVGVLEYGEWTFNINGESLTTRAYRQEGGTFSIPGPTITMSPGNKYVLRFRNLLDYEAPDPDHNVLKDPNITNVHTHGLHISGKSPGDDVTRMFEGGRGGDYVYDIPADHMGGTFWYHAHHHGSTMLQVSTGGFGFMVIDDSGDGIPANVAAMEERLVLLGYLDPGAAGTGGDTLVSGTLPAGWTVNGKVNGDLCVQRDTWQHWRVLLADRDAKPKNVSVGDNCEVKLLARDGVWRTTAPKDLPTATVNLTGASRADLAVRCSADSDIKVAGNVVASIRVGGTADPGPHPYAADGVSTWSTPNRPAYLRDLRGANNVSVSNINMGARTVNGSKFDLATPTLTVSTAGIQEFSIKGATQHPFHLHVYHMQAMAGCGGDFEEGEYYDTIAASCRVRLDLNPDTSTVYAGRTIMHCHILEHEDQGAMGWMDVAVAGATPEPEFPQDQAGNTPYSASYTLSTNPPSAPASPSDLSAAAANSSTINLAWIDNADNEDGFTVERSADNIAFDAVGSVGANGTSFSDLSLAADTTYWYRVFAVNVVGSSGYSDVATATTPPLAEATDVSVESVTVTSVNGGQGNRRGQATVTVIDNTGSPVSGATVTGDFSGSISQIGLQATTDGSGAAVLQTTTSQKGNLSLTFCVSSVSYSLPFIPSANDCASN